MLPSRPKLDPQGYYARLGLEPVAPQASIVAAFRAKARLLHPDVRRTGDAAAFVAVKQAYDVLSNRERRAAYDRMAREAAGEAAGEAVPHEVVVTKPDFYHPRANMARPPQRSPLPIVALAGLGACLFLGVYEITRHLAAPSPVSNAGIKPNAATVAPLSASEHRAVLYGPAPVRLAGNPNFYVVPAGSPAVVWRHDADHDKLVALLELPPFSSVQVVRLIRKTAMLEVMISNLGTGFISAEHLMPGDAEAARSAYCSYNSGPTPFDGELLERQGTGSSTLSVENRALQPAVVKFRDQTGAAIVAVFLGPGSRTELSGLPEGLYRPEFAIGEMWSRACNLFAAGMQARRMDEPIRLPGSPPIVLAPDGGEPPASDVSDQAFEQD
jgi:DnaJ domain